MGGVLQMQTSLDVNFVIVKNVLAGKYKVSNLTFLFLQGFIQFDSFLHQCIGIWNFYTCQLITKLKKLIYKLSRAISYNLTMFVNSKWNSMMGFSCNRFKEEGFLYLGSDDKSDTIWEGILGKGIIADILW